MPRVTLPTHAIKLVCFAVVMATVACFAAVPRSADAKPVGPCNVGANTPNLQPDPIGYQGGPRVGYSGGIACAQTTGYISVQVCLRVLGQNGATWFVVSGTCGTNTHYNSTFVGWGSVHDGADGHLYDTIATGTTSYGTVIDVSTAWQAP